MEKISTLKKPVLITIVVVLAVFIFTNPSASEFESHAKSLTRKWGYLDERCLSYSRIKNGIFFSKYAVTDLCHKEDGWKDRYRSIHVTGYLGQFRVGREGWF